MTYDQADECRGASGRKLRQVCVWCDRFRRHHERSNERKDPEDPEKIKLQGRR